MSSIQLLPEDEGEAIEVPDASTVIGRGAFLKVIDKRVSRSHALLEVIDGKLHLTPTHTNPCFFRQKGKGPQQVLKRDLRQPLEEGDMFGLLPDQLFYTISYASVSLNGVKKNGENSEPVKKEAGQPSPVKKNEKIRKTVRKEEPEEEDTESRQGMVSFRDVICADGKNMALPLTKKRKLPDWMVRLSKSSAPARKKKAAPIKTTTPAKRAAVSKPVSKKKNADFFDDDEEDERPPRKGGKPVSDDDSDEWEEEPQKWAKTKRRRRQSDDSDLEEEQPKKRKGAKQQRRRGLGEEDEDSAASAPRGRGKHSGSRGQEDSDKLPTRRPKRAATKNVGSYEDVLLGDEFADSDEAARRVGSDSDFRMEGNDDGDSGSDWDKRRQSPKKPARKAAGRTPARRGGKRKAGRGSNSEEDDFEELEEEYVPRPSKRRAGADQRGGKAADSEEEEDVPRPSKRRAGAGQCGGKAADSEEEEEEVKVQKKVKKSPPKKGRRPCYYGSKCYRRNPEHFRQFSHPGDSDWEGEEEESDPDAKATKDRKKGDNKDSTSETSKAPVKKKKTKSDEEEDDDGLPNTYDYNDSFINDVGSQSLSQTQRTEGNSDEEEEDLEELKKEAKSFIRNKKMMKPVADDL